MKYLLILLLVAFNVHAEDLVIYQTDPYGKVRKNVDHYVLKDDGRIYVADPYGKVRYNIGSYKVNPDGTIVTFDPYGKQAGTMKGYLKK
jgi:hypothetical protein